MKKIFRRVALVLLSFLVCSVSIFSSVFSDLKVVKPMVVNAESNNDATTIGTTAWGIIAVMLGMMGITFGTKNISKTISQLWTLYVNSTQAASDYVSQDFVPHVVGGSLTLGINALKAIQGFAEWIKTDYKISLGVNTIQLPAESLGNASYLLTGSHTGEFSTNTNSWGANDAYTFSITSSPSARLMQLRDENYSKLYIVAVSDVDFFISYTSHGTTDSTLTPETITSQQATFSNNYYIWIKQVSDWVHTYDTNLPCNQFGNGTLYDLHRDLNKIAIYYGFGAGAIAPPLNDVALNENSENELKDTSLTTDNVLLLDGLKSMLDKYHTNAQGVIQDIAIAQDNTISLDDINEAIDNKIATDTKAVPLDPAIPETYPLADDIPDTKPVPTNYTEPTTTESQKYAVLGLKDVFPFCIPFDLVSFITALKADPVTPKVTLPLHFAGILDYDLTIDLSDFDTVATVFRACELVLTIIGLMFITKGMLGDK